MDYCVVYVSTSIELLLEIELATLLLQSRRDDACFGIIPATLLCLSGRIIQILDEEKEAINALFNRIKKERRHTNMNTFFHGPTDSNSLAHFNRQFIPRLPRPT
ncbi:BLUF domain-containing protein [Spirosoma pollinicola]|uniref:BLUF domain-containing protein n=1 Tax=Spirosoma pollinicola TaxID=2057025 RepID=A0A2K8YVA6_9BACT|nr:BLUF domain-containing protein [Spirosoma pollinicola]AUD01570.1 hypothetical protein CWM47_06915 [Spirosoma pollinicola]